MKNGGVVDAVELLVVNQEAVGHRRRGSRQPAAHDPQRALLPAAPPTQDAQCLLRPRGKRAHQRHAEAVERHLLDRIHHTVWKIVVAGLADVPHYRVYRVWMRIVRWRHACALSHIRQSHAPEPKYYVLCAM